MKINKGWFFQNLLLFVGYLIMLYALWSGSTSVISLGEGLKYWPFFLMIIIVALIASLLCIFDVLKGKAYYKFIDIPINKFDVKQYDNMIILAQQNHAWTFTYKRDTIAELKVIKAIEYYDIKKEFISWDIIPY